MIFINRKIKNHYSLILPNFKVVNRLRHQRYLFNLSLIHEKNKNFFKQAISGSGTVGGCTTLTHSLGVRSEDRLGPLTRVIKLKTATLLNLEFSNYNAIIRHTTAMFRIWTRIPSNYFNPGIDFRSEEALLHRLSNFLYKKSRFGFFAWRYAIYFGDRKRLGGVVVSARRNLNNFLNFYKHTGLLIPLALGGRVSTSDITKYYPIYVLYWTFTDSHRMYINMRNLKDQTYNYFSLFPGLFLSFYKNKRPLKKTKLFKFLMVKYLRKILMHSRVKHLYLVVNKMITLFSELFNTFTTPDIVPYSRPDKKGQYDDYQLNYNKATFLIHKFIFMRGTFFASQKTAQRGRIKRKIRRRLVSRNRILD